MWKCDARDGVRNKNLKKIIRFKISNLDFLKIIAYPDTHIALPNSRNYLEELKWFQQVFCKQKYAPLNTQPVPFRFLLSALCIVECPLRDDKVGLQPWKIIVKIILAVHKTNMIGF